MNDKELAEDVYMQGMFKQEETRHKNPEIFKSEYKDAWWWTRLRRRWFGNDIPTKPDEIVDIYESEEKKLYLNERVEL